MKDEFLLLHKLTDPKDSASISETLNMSRMSLCVLNQSDSILLPSPPLMSDPAPLHCDNEPQKVLPQLSLSQLLPAAFAPLDLYYHTSLKVGHCV